MEKDTSEKISCPCCGGVSAEHWGSEGGFSAVKCAVCGLVYVNPRPRVEHIEEATQIGVHRTETTALNVRAKRHYGRIRHYRTLIRNLLAGDIAKGSPMRWLDIGAGYGEFVQALDGTLPPGSIIEGIEPMRHKAEAARSLGLNVRTATISSVDGKYDAISLINVFSHIPDFQMFGREIAARLRPGGILFIETGNGGDLPQRSDYPDRLYLPDHLVFAGRENIRFIVERLGFRVDTLKASRLDGPLFVAKSFVKGILAREFRLRLPYTSPFRTLYLVARKTDDATIQG
jgi:2-polyprenyl-3-methyl-5-hydroxy-6-metoxy-1,4-benzoquinol methylase